MDSLIGPTRGGGGRLAQRPAPHPLSGAGQAFLIGAISWAFSIVVLRALAKPNRSDVITHVTLLQESRATDRPLGYSVYYALLEWLSGGDLNTGHLLNLSVIMLGCAMAFKIGLTFLIVRHGTGSPRIVSLSAAVFLFLVMPLNLTLSDEFYLGRFTGTIWHNSTTIMLIPIGIVAFYVCLEYLTKESHAWWMHVLVGCVFALSAAVKPNHVLTLVPAAAVFVLVRKRGMVPPPCGHAGPAGRGMVLRLAVLGLPAVGVLLTQYVLVSQPDALVRLDVQVRFMQVWDILLNGRSAALALLESFLLPVVIAGVLRRRALSSSPVVLSFISLGVALVQFILLAEIRADGRVDWSANWSWGVMVSTYLVYLAVTVLWLKHADEVTSRAVRALVYTLATVQVGIGLAYLARLAGSQLAYA